MSLYIPAAPEQNTFTKVLQAHIQNAIKDFVNTEAEEASQRLKKKIQEALPQIVMAVFDDYSVSFDGKQTMVIKVQLKESKTNA